MRLPYYLLPLLSCSVMLAAESGAVGSAVCGQCHKNIAASQAKTNMAMTWQGASTRLLPANYAARKQEGSAKYTVERTGRQFRYRVEMPEGASLEAPVETIMGGERHGLSFLVRVQEIEGLKLERATLMETRYMHGAHEKNLVLSPGFPTETPSTWETAIGRPLSPEFEHKCLACHGQPSGNATAGGVHCETCHGAGEAHLKAVAKGQPKNSILNPAKLSREQSMEKCAQCHSGFSELSDPMPEDLLISNQVNALKNSECYIQSGKALSCAQCHDPHQDSLNVETRSTTTCLSCHGADVKPRAALCPVNQKSGCVGCHMPTEERGPFRLVDHWIRAHSEQAVHAAPELRSQVRPLRVFLTIIVMDDRAKADAVRARLAAGEPFFELAQQNSQAASAPGGGYLGEMRIAEMDPKLGDAAAALAPGEISPVVMAAGKAIIFERLPRDFRWRANQLQEEGSQLKRSGKLEQAADKYTEALKIYPRFLRALVFFGATLGEQGNAPRAAGVLEFASRLYPNDPAAEYNLGIAYGALGRTADEMQAYRRAIELEPDLLPAYQNLGAALFAAGQFDRAAEAYRRGLEANPLSAMLYYNLSVVRERQGDGEGARAALALASKIDPDFVRKQQAQ